MIILLETYVGSSDFRFEPSCTGRKLEEAELREHGLISDEILRNHKDSSYVSEWYEVKEGDQIRILRSDDEGELDETFVVPMELPDVPQHLDDVLHTGMWLYVYLAKHCQRVA